MIEIRNLTKRYDDGTVALDRLSLTMDKRITTVLGRNGAGKSTLIKILSTQLMPTSGSVSIGDLDLVEDVQLVRDVITSIPQDVRTMGVATPYEHIEMYLNARALPPKDIKSQADRALKELSLWSVRDKSAADLSGGMKRKIFVAMALASRAEIVFLDEPTTGLDPISRIEVWSAIKKLKSTVIITTHYMEEAKELSDEVVLIDGGKKVAQGTVAQLLMRFDGKVRVEGPKGKYKVGSTHISYLMPSAAKPLIEKGYTVKQISLEDLFIIHGGGIIES